MILRRCSRLTPVSELSKTNFRLPTIATLILLLVGTTRYCCHTGPCRAMHSLTFPSATATLLASLDALSDSLLQISRPAAQKWDSQSPSGTTAMSASSTTPAPDGLDSLALPYFTFDESLKLASINQVASRVFGEEAKLGVNASWFLTRDGSDEGQAIAGDTTNSTGETESLQLTLLRKRLKRFALGHNKAKTWGDSILLEYWTGSEGARQAYRCEAIVQSFSPKAPTLSSFPSSESSYSVLLLKPVAHVIPDRHLDPRYFVPSPPIAASPPTSQGFAFPSSPLVNTDTVPEKTLSDFYDNLTAPVLKEEHQFREMIDNLPQVCAVKYPSAVNYEACSATFFGLIGTMTQICFTADKLGNVDFFNRQW